MGKNYVPKTLSEFLLESKSITLKRKYGERPAVNAGVNAPLRNRVLSFIAESDSVSKADLKKFIMGLKEGGSPVAANMFISRNAKYFITESKNDNTYFKLSNLGERLINQFTKSNNLSESFVTARKKFSSILENRDRSVQIEDDDNNENFDVEETEDEIIFTYHKNKPEDIDDDDDSEEVEFKDDDIDVDDEDEENELESEDDDEDDEDVEENDELEDDDLDDIEDYEDRSFDFKDKGRPGLQDSAELDENQIARMKNIIKNLKRNRLSTGDFVEINESGEKYEIVRFDKDSKEYIVLDENDQKWKYNAKLLEENSTLIKSYINEADEAKSDEADELSDKDVEETPESTETSEEPNLENETEKVEITEFIITVDDVDSAIEELGELGVHAERVPVEKPVEEVPTEEPEEPAAPAEPTAPQTGPQTPEQQQLAKESLAAFVKNMLYEAEQPDNELGLGDQGEVTSELDQTAPTEPTDEPVPATEEFEQNKIKVNAQDWDALKGWLEEKGVNVQEMFGGEIETEDIDGDAPEGAEVSDEEIDFTGIGDDDDTEVKTED